VRDGMAGTEWRGVARRGVVWQDRRKEVAC
jgi:hypothetical protein